MTHRSIYTPTSWHALAFLFFLSSVVTAEELPAPLKALQAQGVEVVQAFSAPEGLTGYAVEMRGQSFAVYITESGEHALVGTLIDSEGNDMSASTVQALVEGPRYKANWDKLAQSEWVADGDDGADHIVYAFTDPNCPYCHKLWEVSRPWIEAGQVQIRHIMVGILRPSSPGKAAAILAAEDPSQALVDHESSFDKGGIKPLEDVPGEVQSVLARNYQLMERFGAQATPTVIYQDDAGEVHLVRGLPSPAQRSAMFGPRPE